MLAVATKAVRMIRRSQVKPEDLDREAQKRELFQLYGPAPYTNEQYLSVVPIIVSDPDPISKSEQRARAKFDGAIIEAEARFIAAQERYDIAMVVVQNAHSRWTELQQRLSSMYRPSGGPVGDAAEIKGIRGAEQAADDAFNDAADVLGKAQRKLNGLLRQQDLAGHIARNG